MLICWVGTGVLLYLATGVTMYVSRKVYELMYSKEIAAQKIRMANKTVIVTGANTGIGYATAEGLAAMGAKVILACRDRVRG